MRLLNFLACALLLPVLAAAPTATNAQTTESDHTIQALAAQSALLANIDTIYRLSEDLVFWQSVALLGVEFDWEFNIHIRGSARQPWNLPLNNLLVKSQTEAMYALKRFADSAVATAEEKQTAERIFALHLEMRQVATELSALLRDNQIVRAAALFESRTLVLRRQIANATYSASAYLREEINFTAHATLRYR